MSIETLALPAKYHQAILEWQKRHFRDYPYFFENWSKFYRQAPFQLTAKLGPLKSGTIECGRNAGKKRFERVADMDEETRAQCRKIIRAQASTELGSVQQHRESLHKAQDERIQFDVLRVMAEEFRHGYQMIYLLASDDWGGGDTAMEAIEELLAMETGSHVLDAFNVYFDSFVDNIVFAAVIDRVGKYQLQMQQVFAYAPMGRSMAPMLSEEAFHLATGTGPLRQLVRDAALDRGNVSIENIQQHLNKWIPRGLEMFGDERGGKTNVELGLKNMANAEAAEKYYQELKTEVVDLLNAEILRARAPKMERELIGPTTKEILEGEQRHGLKLEELLYLPDARFFRRRGVHAFKMTGAGGLEYASIDQYLKHLRKVLPAAYVTGRDFSTYLANLAHKLEGTDVREGELPFFG